MEQAEKLVLIDALDLHSWLVFFFFIVFVINKFLMTEWILNMVLREVRASKNLDPTSAWYGLAEGKKKI